MSRPHTCRDCAPSPWWAPGWWPASAGTPVPFWWTPRCWACLPPPSAPVHAGSGEPPAAPTATTDKHDFIIFLFLKKEFINQHDFIMETFCLLRCTVCSLKTEFCLKRCTVCFLKTEYCLKRFVLIISFAQNKLSLEACYLFFKDRVLSLEVYCLFFKDKALWERCL